MIDHLFEYSLVTGDTTVNLEEPESLPLLFYDLLSETCSYLQQKGFRIVFQVEWEEHRLRIRTDYLTRIMDNITSNIIKYADSDEPVMIRSVYYGDRVGFLFVFYCCYYFFKCQGQLKASWFPVENSTIYLYAKKVIGVRKTL